MNSAITQLEERLQKLERMREDRKAWLNDLITPYEARFEALNKIRHAQQGVPESNIIRFPIEKVAAENDAR